jgi:uncharacterized protein (TIGR02391 family)
MSANAFPINAPALAVELGDYLKYDTTINEIDRCAATTLGCARESFPNPAITSQRAQGIYDWVLSSAKHSSKPEVFSKKIVDFVRRIAPSERIEAVFEICRRNGISSSLLGDPDAKLFYERAFHSNVQKHSKSLFLQKNYFHAVFEACKAFNNAVREKSKMQKDGESLMLAAWDPANGSLKVTACVTETDRNIQDGLKFLSAGVMKAMRNPTAHEPALEWPISKQDCLDFLGFISFLWSQLDKAQYYRKP